jgi:putative addiction module killer protein
MKIVEYLTLGGVSPFRNWFDGLESRAAAKVTTALTRLGLGNTSNVKSLGSGVFEYKIDYGPGYRVYFGVDGKELVILVGGGTKKRQSSDIKNARNHWADFEKRKKNIEKGG